LTDALLRAEKAWQHIDGLVLNAGTLDPLGRIGDDSMIASWKHHFDVNFFSHVTAMKATLPSLRQSVLGARVIFISSGNAVKGPTGMGPYSASKAAVNSLCRHVTVARGQAISLILLKDSWK
jgi:NAD(P)-dependent dehydrogenase (short-subunit alcohol dehydrogenase family)